MVKGIRATAPGPFVIRHSSFVISEGLALWHTVSTMPAKMTSQWDFGELFPPSATRRVFTVTELTTTLRRLLEKEVGTVWLTGEVTNLRAQSSGHIYFTLKDA